MPLKEGMSMESAMHDLKHGPHHKNRTHKQEVAIAMKYAKKKHKKKGKKGKKAHRKK